MHLDNYRQAIIRHRDFKPLIRWLASLAHHLPYPTVIRPYTKRRFHVTHHVRQKYFYSITVTNLYQAVSISRLARLLADYADNIYLVAEIEECLRKHCCLSSGQLDPNCPAAPYLANLYHGFIFDRFLGSWCRSYCLLVTRYRNHLIFSSQHPIGRRLKRVIRHRVMDHGFTIDQRPPRRCDRQHRPINFFGVGLNTRGEIVPARRLITRLRGLLHRARTHNDIPATQIQTQMGVLTRILYINGRQPTKSEQRILTSYTSWKNTLSPVTL